jgi:broad specificity phosphatase PhoE
MEHALAVPLLFAESISRVSPISPKYPAELQSELEIEGIFSSVPDLIESFRFTIGQHQQSVRRMGHDSRAKLVVHLTEAVTLIEQQCRWAVGANAVWPFLRYVALGHVAYPALISLLRMGDPGMRGHQSQQWLERRLRFGTSATDFLQDVQLSLEGNTTHSVLIARLCFWQAAMMVDYVALPMLSSAESDTLTAVSAMDTLERADKLLGNGLGPTQDNEIYYWRSKLYRHLAMACIKIGACGPALLYLAVSSLYGRHVQDRDLFSELSIELMRGYAEAHKILGNDSLVDRFLRRTPFTKADIAKYVGSIDAQALDRLPIHVVLIRHGERRSDEHRRFGFDADVTDRGRREFNYVGRTLRQLLDEAGTGTAFIYSSPQLKNEAEDLRSQIVRESSGLMAEIIVDSRLQPIDVGVFRGLSEIEAQNRYPGTYRDLQEYRLSYLDGYNLRFPDGEGVYEFDRRIMDVFCEILADLAGCNRFTRQEFLLSVQSRSVVFFGHTSTLTAILNMLRSLGHESLEIARYGFEPIETGSITELRVDLARRARQGEARRLPGGVEEFE